MQFRNFSSYDEFDASGPLLSVVSSFIYIVSLASFAISIGAVITYILWFRRAYANLHKKVNYLSYAEGWAAGSWFVPILQLFRPYQIMQEMYQETDDWLSKNVKNYTPKFKYPYVGLWWILWIIVMFVGYAAVSLSAGVRGMNDIQMLLWINIFSNLISIPLCFVAVKVIQDYAAMETLLFDVEGGVRKPTAVDHELLDTPL